MSESPDSAPDGAIRRLPVILTVIGFVSVTTALLFSSDFFPGDIPDKQAPSLPDSAGQDSQAISTTHSDAGSRVDPAPPADATGTDATGTDATGTESQDTDVARTRDLLSGTWTREAYGTRTLTISADGTASLTIEPSAFYAVVFGARIDATIQWELQDGFLDYRITSAVPEEKFELARKTWGDHWHEKIKTLNETTLTLLGEDDQEYVWTRMEDTQEATPDQST